MRSNGDIVVLANNIHGLIRCMSDDVDLGVSDEEIRNHFAHGELRGRDARGEPHRAGGLSQSMTNCGLGLFGLLQHRDRVVIELTSSIGHPEAP